tara:strand:+ start:485 stop:787 length:303 start_codon:yes stop_codon:yes gene_type:complete
MYFQTQIEIDNCELIEEVSDELTDWLRDSDVIETVTHLIGEMNETVNDLMDLIELKGLELEELEQRLEDTEQRLAYYEESDVADKVRDALAEMSFTLEVN